MQEILKEMRESIQFLDERTEQALDELDRLRRNLERLERDAAEHRHAPVTGQATDKADGASDGGALSWWCENGHVNNVQPKICWLCESPRQTVSDKPGGAPPAPCR